MILSTGTASPVPSSLLVPTEPDRLGIEVEPFALIVGHGCNAPPSTGVQNQRAAAGLRSGETGCPPPPAPPARGRPPPRPRRRSPWRLPPRARHCCRALPPEAAKSKGDSGAAASGTGGASASAGPDSARRAANVLFKRPFLIMRLRFGPMRPGGSGVGRQAHHLADHRTGGGFQGKPAHGGFFGVDHAAFQPRVIRPMRRRSRASCRAGRRSVHSRRSRFPAARTHISSAAVLPGAIWSPPHALARGERFDEFCTGQIGATVKSAAK